MAVYFLREAEQVSVELIKAGDSNFSRAPWPARATPPTN